MTKYNKAVGGGGVGVIAPSLEKVLTWAFNIKLGMPEDIAFALSTVVIGLLGAIIVYLIPQPTGTKVTIEEQKAE